MADIKLPTTPIKVDKVNPVVSVFYGATKVGKTAALAALPENLIIDLERGAETYECLRVRADNYKDFRNILQTLSDNAMSSDEPMYKYITIDTVDRLVEWFEIDVKDTWNASVKAEDKVGVYSEIPYGKGYDLVRLKMRQFIIMMRRMVPHIILVGHLKRTIIGETSIEVKEDNLDLVGKLRNMVCAEADAVGYFYRARDEKDSEEDDNPKVLKISFKTSENTAAGSRMPHLRGKAITISRVLDAEKGTYENYWNEIFPV